MECCGVFVAAFVVVVWHFFASPLIHRLLRAHGGWRNAAVMPFPSNVTTQAASALMLLLLRPAADILPGVRALLCFRFVSTFARFSSDSRHCRL